MATRPPGHGADALLRRGSGAALSESEPWRRRSIRTSLVQQKLQTALSQAEQTVAAEPASPEPDTSASQLGKGFQKTDDVKVWDRSIVRYRNDAAIISFADSAANPFVYSQSFMPGVHFYTFLATKDTSSSGSSQAGDNPDNSVADYSGKEPSTIVKKTRRLRIRVPDTIVYGETGRAVWLHTDKDGFVQRKTAFTDKDVLDKLSASMGDNDPVCVCKEPIVSTSKHTTKQESDAHALTYQGNISRIMSPNELKTLLSNVAANRKSYAIQKFVRCNASKAFVVRAVYEANKPAYAWMINNIVSYPEKASSINLMAAATSTVNAQETTPIDPIQSPSTEAIFTPRLIAGPPIAVTSSNSAPPASGDTIPLVNRYCTSVPVDKSCTFVKLTERGCATVSELNLRIVKYIEHRLRLQLQSLIADFIRDTDGHWWLLQVKAFRVQSKFHSERALFLPLNIRHIYLGYRDSRVIEDDHDSDGDHKDNLNGRNTAASLPNRHIRKLVQCKCCQAPYPKSELSYKMTLKMINDMLIRLRSRLPYERKYTFLAAAMSRELPDASLAYESWSVCSYCYAIYERDQQLQRIEVKVALALGLPNPKLALDGFSRIQDGTYELDPSTNASILPSQLTLCRLMLVLNAIYDIPSELYDAEKLFANDTFPGGASKDSTSRLYLRITALGYTECIAVNAADIILAKEKAPKAQRKTSTASIYTDDEDEDGDNEGIQHAGSSERNYWLPINIIRTIHFFAPRTPLQSKLKETSGLTPFLNEDNSILVQFIRATSPPLQDPDVVKRQSKKRRAAIAPPDPSSGSHAKRHAQPPANHSVVLGATKIRMAQFRSAFVTKIDFYACMAITGEMFNIKGNIGLERLRYVDTKLLTSQYRLRTYNGVFIPDDSYMTNEPLSSEWMDCLSISFHRKTKSEKIANKSISAYEDTKSLATGRMAASTSTIFADDEAMDEELEEMIDRANIDKQADFQTSPTNKSDKARADTAPASSSMETLKQELLPSRQLTSQTDHQMTELLKKTMISPQATLGTEENIIDTTDLTSPREIDATFMVSPRNRSWLWSMVILLNQAHNLQSREHSFCRWECRYKLFTQKRSAIERNIGARASSPTDVNFSCSHRFYLLGTTAMMRSHVKNNSSLSLHLRNDIYASTRSQSSGEYCCVLDLSKLLQQKSFEATLDIRPTSSEVLITPREAAPYLSVSVHLSQLPCSEDDILQSESYVNIATTTEGLRVLRKVS